MIELATTLPIAEDPPPPVPPASVAPTAPSAEIVKAEPPRDRVLIFLLVAFVGLIGNRWFQDSRHSTRPVSSSPGEEIVQKIDLNSAGKAELQQLPGVGPAKADRILTQRESQGKLNGLQGVPGFGEKSVQRLQGHIQTEYLANEPDVLTRRIPPVGIDAAKPPAGRKAVPNGGIDVNSATLAELQKLPGIGAVMAQRIVAERERRKFEKADDLRRVSGIGAKKLDQIRPYLLFE